MRILGVRYRRDICRATAALLLFTASAAGQIPDKFENLQVLPKTISKKDLVAAMVNISLATGLRCENCHVGEGGPELKNMTYPADDKETKRTARIMLRMVQAINQDYITNLGRESPIKVECATCHHGVSRPQTLQALLAETLDRKGLTAAVAQYRDLRKDYYGRALTTSETSVSISWEKPCLSRIKRRPSRQFWSLTSSSIHSPRELTIA